MIGEVITRLQAITPHPFAAIEGLAELAALTDAPLASPVAYVFIKDEAAGENERLNGVLQRVEADIAVVIVVRNDADTTGAAAGQEAAPIEAAVLAALLGQQLPGTDDIVTFVSSATVRATRGQVWRELVFATAYYLEA